MKALLTISVALAVAVAGAQTPGSNLGQNQIRHIETSLNHLTVLEFGEPVATLAIADPDSFQVERHDDKVFLKPLKEGVATNLFIWTASRQFNYELDPAGQLAKMDVLVEVPPPSAHTATHAAAEPTDAEIRKIAGLVLTQALMGTESITHDSSRVVADRVRVNFDQVFRSKDLLYIRYSVTNQTSAPFRLTRPDIYAPSPTEVPISLVSLSGHQLAPQTFAAFKAKPGASLSTVEAETTVTDLAPGQTTTGVVSIRSAQGNPPQLYQLNVGADPKGPVTAEAVL
jgi:hypothetical protein